MENGRCRLHGGATPRGLANPNTKSGRWSKDLPTRLAAKYEAALADQKLLELRDELAVIDTRLSELLGKVDTGEAGALWDRLRKVLAELRAAKGDPDKQRDLLSEMMKLVEGGAEDWMTWDDVFRTIERRARIAESERRRLVEMQQMMSNEQAMTLLAAVVDTVRRHVTDRDALKGISADLSRLIAHGQAQAPN